jgi:LacI family transcriptional regulator
VKDKGVTCPKDIAILGFDGVMPGNYTIPRLSSVKFPVLEAGRLAAQILKAVTMNRRADKKHVLKAFIREGSSA